MRANFEKFLKKQISDMAARLKINGDLVEDGGPPEEIQRLLNYQLYDQGMMGSMGAFCPSLVGFQGRSPWSIHKPMEILYDLSLSSM